MSRQSEQLVDKLKSRITKVNWDYNDLDTGTVFTVGDGIVFARGLTDVLAGELVRFENGTEGMALNLEENQVGIILLGSDAGIKEDDYVYRTHEVANVPVGEAMLGRVVDTLGRPMDGKGPIDTDQFNVVERPAPGVMARRSVYKPLFTGIKQIDSMIPIGRGQRELIIGDRQTGKTSIAINAILNQKGQGVKCVYVAIGQKSSTVANVVETLRRHGAMDYTVVVNSPADDSAAMQYLAPYSGSAIGEYWMDQGEDVLIIYDDLSKHAVAYRTISLLLRRPSGREAYPGDVFYLHSRLLERSGQLNDELGGGSMTALPIIETQLGDISAYITTNVISITDGQVFLDVEAFASGQRPAIDSGLSVSRVGSEAQTQAMRKVSASLRLELAAFEELQAFAQFSSDIDEETQKTIDHGRKLTMLLRQGATSVVPHEFTILSLFMNRYGWLDKLEIDQVLPFEQFMYEAFRTTYSDVLAELADGYVLTDELIDKIQDRFGKIFREFEEIHHGQ